MAIYAFTIVTIIFLPLSAVSGIFGMNTNDVRNMDLDQWAYWATAVPVTIATIVLGLWWMGELRNMFRWVVNLGRMGRQSGYALGRPSSGGWGPVLQPSSPVRVVERVERVEHTAGSPVSYAEAPRRTRVIY